MDVQTEVVIKLSARQAADMVLWIHSKTKDDQWAPNVVHEFHDLVGHQTGALDWGIQ